MSHSVPSLDPYISANVHTSKSCISPFCDWVFCIKKQTDYSVQGVPKLIIISSFTMMDSGFCIAHIVLVCVLFIFSLFTVT